MNMPSLPMLEQAAQAGNDGARIELANRLLSEHRPHGAEHERGLQLLREASLGARRGEALWLLGAYFLQVTTWPDAHAEAARWLERAAAEGVPPAIDRLADLHLRGLGVDLAPARALELQRHLAACGFPQAAWEVGYLLGACGLAADGGAAVTAFARAAALGYAPAYYSLGLRYALGAGVQRDAAFARALLLRAADARFPDARDAADELVPAAQAGEAAQTWYLRLKANMDAADALLDRLRPIAAPPGAPIHPLLTQAEAHFAALGHPSLRLDEAGRLDVRGDGSAALHAVATPWDWRSAAPRVAVSDGFATREECAHLMHKVADSLTEASQYRRRSSRNDDTELFNFSGRGRPLGPLHSDAVVRVLERRIAALTDWSVGALEPCSIVRYQVGEEYRPHVDYFSDEQIALNAQERGDLGGQRVATFLVYLRAPQAGGETVYHASNVAVAGKPGMGVLHYNVTPNGRQDDASLHSGQPVRAGEKWLWRSTLRERSLAREGG